MGGGWLSLRSSSVRYSRNLYSLLALTAVLAACSRAQDMGGDMGGDLIVNVRSEPL